jgi:hypothetical protein
MRDVGLSAATVAGTGAIVDGQRIQRAEQVHSDQQGGLILQLTGPKDVEPPKVTARSAMLAAPTRNSGTQDLARLRGPGDADHRGL